MSSLFDKIEVFFTNYYHTFSVITNILIAIGTIGAVIYSISITINSNKNKFKFSFSDDARLFDDKTGNHLEIKYIYLNIVNAGNKIAKITGWGMFYKNSKWCFFLQPNDDYVKIAMKGYNEAFEPGNDINLYYEYNTFCNVVKKYCDNKIIKYNAIPKIFVKDSIGKIYKIKTKKIALDYIKDISFSINI